MRCDTMPLMSQNESAPTRYLTVRVCELAVQVGIDLDDG